MKRSTPIPSKKVNMVPVVGSWSASTSMNPPTLLGRNAENGDMVSAKVTVTSRVVGPYSASIEVISSCTPKPPNVSPIGSPTGASDTTLVDD